MKSGLGGYCGISWNTFDLTRRERAGAGSRPTSARHGLGKLIGSSPHKISKRKGHAEIVLAVVENHFVARIKGRLYDVTGDVTEEYKNSVLVAWDQMDKYDSLQKERIVRDCIVF